MYVSVPIRVRIVVSGRRSRRCYVLGVVWDEYGNEYAKFGYTRCVHHSFALWGSTLTWGVSLNQLVLNVPFCSSFTIYSHPKAHPAPEREHVVEHLPQAEHSTINPAAKYVPIRARQRTHERSCRESQHVVEHLRLAVFAKRINQNPPGVGMSDYIRPRSVLQASLLLGHTTIFRKIRTVH